MSARQTQRDRQRRRALAYPSDVNSLRRVGTDGCHHFQSVGFLANVLPDALVINVESYTISSSSLVPRSYFPELTRSNAAMRCLFSVDAGFVFASLVYLPTTKVLSTIRQLIGSGFFCERGVKKLAADFSVLFVFCKYVICRGAIRSLCIARLTIHASF